MVELWKKREFLVEDLKLHCEVVFILFYGLCSDRGKGVDERIS